MSGRDRSTHDSKGLCWPIKAYRLQFTVAYGHTTLNTPDLVQSRKLSRVGLGIPGAVSFLSLLFLLLADCCQSEILDNLEKHQGAPTA